MFCNADTVKMNCSEEYCECVHHLKVELGDTVELIVIDEGKPFAANHPMHLHGHRFRVIGMDKVSFIIDWLFFNHLYLRKKQKQNKTKKINSKIWSPVLIIYTFSFIKLVNKLLVFLSFLTTLT